MENIDPAFIRRFSTLSAFPATLSDRLRIWRLSFPPEAPLGADVDFNRWPNPT